MSAQVSDLRAQQLNGNTGPPPMDSAPIYVRALYDYTASDASALGFRRNDLIEVITQLDSGWWDGRCRGHRGWFPSNFVELVEEGRPGAVVPDSDASWANVAETTAGSLRPYPDDSALTRGTINKSALQFADSSSFISVGATPNASAADHSAMSSASTIGHIVLAADDEVVHDKSSAVLRLSQIPANAWISQTTADGHIYYFNPTSRVTAWELPPDGRELTAEEAARLAAGDTGPPTPLTPFDSSDIYNTYMNDGLDSPRTMMPASPVQNGFHPRQQSPQMRRPSQNSLAQQHHQQQQQQQHHHHHQQQQQQQQRRSPSMNGMRTGPAPRPPPLQRQLSRSSITPPLASPRSIHAARQARPNGNGKLPPYWGMKKTPQGRVYYYHMITDVTAWSLDTVDLATGKLLDNATALPNANTEANGATADSHLPPLRKASGFNGAGLPGIGRKASQDTINSITPALSTDTGVTWSRLVAFIVLAIHRLNHSAKHACKSAYIADASLIVDMISAMLLASGTMKRDSTAIKAHSMLKTHHNNLMTALPKLILAAKEAARIWPPPDAVQQMQRDANDVLLAARHFMKVAQESGVDVSDVDGVDLDALELELSDPTLNGDRPSDGGQSRGDKLCTSQPPASVDLLVRLCESSSVVLRTVSGMYRHLQQIRTQAQQPAPTGRSLINPNTITLAKTLIAGAERLLKLVDDLARSGQTSDGVMSHLGRARRTLQDAIANLVLTVQEATDPHAAFPAVDDCIRQVRTVDGAVKGLLIASKLQIEERDAQNHRALEANINRFRAIQRNDDPTDPAVRVRRALSMSHMGPDADSNGASAADHDTGFDPSRPVPPVSDRPRPMPASNLSAMANARMKQRMRTEPAIHRGAADAAMHSLAVRSHTSGNVPRMDNGPPSSYPVRHMRANSDATLKSEHSVHTIDSVHESPVESLGSFPIPRELMSAVAPWTVQEPTMPGAAPPPPNSMTAATLYTNGSMSSLSTSDPVTGNMERSSNKLTRLLGENATNANPTPPGSSGNKLKKLLGNEVGDAVSIVSGISKSSLDDKPWYLGYDYDDSEIVFTIDSAVKGGTLRALVERCTLHDALDTTYINNFLLTYRSFTTASEIMDLLCKRYQVQPPANLAKEELEIWQQKKQTPIRLRVVNIMKQWLEMAYQDDEDADVLTMLAEFIRTSMSGELKTPALLKLIEMRQNKSSDYRSRKLVRNIKQEAPPSNIPKNLKRLNGVIDIDPTELARQLTLMDSQLYNKIMPIECLNKAWSDKESNLAINIKNMIHQSTQITNWIIEQIVQESEVRKRIQLIRHFVTVAEKCMALNNFNGLMAIVACFNSAPIFRLKRTWDQVPSKTMTALDALSTYMSPTRNYATYREGLHSIDPPCVPFLGVYLTDLTFIADGNSDKVTGTDFINFSKYSKCADVISEIQQYQNLPYCLNAVPQIQDFVGASLQPVRDDHLLYNMSLEVEPRERDDEMIARLLQEGGFL